jgi:hypothetical protein
MIALGRKQPKPPAITRQQALACIPTRAPSVRESRQTPQAIVLSYTEPLHPVLSAIRNALKKPPEARIRRLELDAMGSAVWDWIDGTSTVADLAIRFSKHYGVLLREAQLSVSQFLRELGKRGIIVLRLPDDPPTRS